MCTDASAFESHTPDLRTNTNTRDHGHKVDLKWECCGYSMIRIITTKPSGHLSLKYIHTYYNTEYISNSPVVKRGLLLFSCAAKLRGFSGRVREVDAGDDCVRDRGRWTPNLLLTPPLLRNMGTARVSICRCSCCNCFCCSHNNDYRKRNGWEKGDKVTDILK